MTNNYAQALWVFCDRIRGIIGYYNFYSRVIKLLFIKYLLTYSDLLDIKDIQSYKAISEFKRKYDEAKNGAFVIGKKNVTELLDSVEFLKKDSNVKLVDLADDLNFFYDPKMQKDVIASLDSFVLKNDEQSMKEVFDYLLYSSYNDVSRTGSFITGKALRRICMGLLDVKNDDIYMDCYAGFSSSLTEIKDLDRYKYIGYEINSDAALISTITCIMMGTPEFEINNEDYLFAETDSRADKVLSDVIFGYKREYSNLAKKYGVTTKDVDVLSFYKAFYSARKDGSVVLAVPGKFLFSTAKAYVELRNRITKEGLRAVISLPPLWQGTSIGTNLIFIDKSYQGDIEFVDATNMKFGDKRESFEIYNAGNVISAVKEHWIVEGEDNCVDIDTALALGTWLPDRYVNTEKKNYYRPVSEIDKELSLLYAQLKENM